MTSPSVAIIGAGLGGLASAREILQRMPHARITIFEVRASVGGVWNYEADALTQQVKFDQHGNPHAAIDFRNMDSARNTLAPVEEVPPSPVYPTLRTNLPVELMSFRGESYGRITDKAFPTHGEVLRYIQAYARKYALLSRVRFEHRVTRVRHAEGAQSVREGYMPTRKDGERDGGGRWSLTVENLSNEHSATYLYDHVVNAAGHYVSPYIPTIDGLWRYDGQLVHSRWWRGPLPYRGKKVVVVGSRSSGYDVTRELSWLNVAPGNVSSPYASHDQDSSLPYTTVIQASRTPPPEWQDAPAWYRGIQQRTPIVHTDARTVTFDDGSVEHDVDVILFATGYNYLFPFMHAYDEPWRSAPVTDDPQGERSGAVKDVPGHKRLDRIIPECAVGHAGLRRNISKHHLLYLPDPSFVFVGLQKNIRPFSLYEAQAHVLAYCFALPLHQPVPDALREPLQISNPDTRKGQVWRFPLEFEMTDEMMEAIGELDNSAYETEQPVWKWAKNPKWAYDRTYNLIQEKRALLGY